MHPLILSIFGTLITLLLDLRWKCRQPAYRYIALFFLLSGIGYFFQAMKAEAYEPIVVKVTNEVPSKSKKEVQKEYIDKCLKKANYHFEEGCSCLKQAEEVSLLFPDIDGFDKSQLCLANFILTLAPGDPTIKAVNAAIALAGQYAMLVMNEYNKFNHLLLQSKSHFEMEEHYRFVGKYQLDLHNIENYESEKKKK